MKLMVEEKEKEKHEKIKGDKNKLTKRTHFHSNKKTKRNVFKEIVT